MTKLKNLITDIEGLRVGNASNDKIKTGATALICDRPMVASCQVLGGAPGTRETDLLEPHNSVAKIDAVVLSGGSAFGLDAASGVQHYLKAKGRGFEVGPHKVPIVPSAILFDLINGGDKNWGDQSPYFALGKQAAETAETDFTLGSIGAGTGALTAGLKGGLGSASTQLDNGIIVGALVAVNAMGSATLGQTGHFWAHHFEQGAEFGGLGPAPAQTEIGLPIKFRDHAEGANTTIAIIATDATLTKAEAKRLAISAHDGFARALWPAHTPFDGDIIFAISSGSKPAPDMHGFIDLCAAAASTMARAIARAVFEATPTQHDLFPTWQNQFGKKRS